MTGPKAVLQASQNDESFTDSIEDLIDEYLELIFPSEDTSETMQLIELMTSRDPDSKIRAIVATEGGIQDFLIKLDKKPCKYASSRNKHFFTKSCHLKTYQNYEQPP